MKIINRKQHSNTVETVTMPLFFATTLFLQIGTVLGALRKNERRVASVYLESFIRPQNGNW